MNHRNKLFRWDHVSLALFLLLASVFSLFLLQQKKATYLDSRVQINNDSLRLAREYGGLLLETIDLQQELYSRSYGPVPLQPKIPNIPVNAPGVRPVSRSSYVELPISERTSARQAISNVQGNPEERVRVQLSYTNRDVEDSRATETFRRLGFNVVQTAMLDGQRSNTIVFGDSVSLENVRIVAITLLASGIKLSRVRRLEPTSGGTAWSLAINSVSYANDWPPLNVAQIDRMTRR